MMKPAVNVAITGAAGQIGYALAFRVASGQFVYARPLRCPSGAWSVPAPPFTLFPLGPAPALPELGGVIMKLNDAASPTHKKIAAPEDAIGVLKFSQPEGHPSYPHPPS